MWERSAGDAPTLCPAYGRAFIQMGPFWFSIEPKRTHVFMCLCLGGASFTELAIKFNNIAFGITNMACADLQ